MSYGRIRFLKTLESFYPIYLSTLAYFTSLGLIPSFIGSSLVTSRESCTLSFVLKYTYKIFKICFIKTPNVIFVSLTYTENCSPPVDLMGFLKSNLTFLKIYLGENLLYNGVGGLLIHIPC